jgi:hypothetical protein
MIRACLAADFDRMYDIINDAARVYEGVIPADRWHYPYMSKDELFREISRGVEFWGCEENRELVGVMEIGRASCRERV